MRHPSVGEAEVPTAASGCRARRRRGPSSKPTTADCSVGRARDEEREGHHVEGPLVHRQQEHDHADQGADVGVHRLGLRVGPTLHQGRHAGQEVGRDGGGDRQDAIAGDEPHDRADHRDRATGVIHPSHFPHGRGVVERRDEDQQGHEAHHEGRQGAQAGAPVESHGSREERSDRPEEPRHPIGLRRASEGVPEVDGRTCRADCGTEVNPILVDHRVTVCCLADLPSFLVGDAPCRGRAARFTTGTPASSEGEAPVHAHGPQQRDSHG